MITRTNLGISPITSVPYTLTYIIPFSLGICTFLCNVIIMIIQKVILGKDLSFKTVVLQLTLTFIFSAFVDLAIFLFGWIIPTKYLTRMLYLIAGCLVVACGMCFVVTSDVVLLPGDGLIKAMSIKFKKEFGFAKVFFDVSCVTTTIILSLIFIGELVAIKEGTIVSLIIIGNTVRFLLKYFKGKLEQNLDVVTNPS